MVNLLQRKYAGAIQVRDERNPLEPYLHQKEALKALDNAIVKSEAKRFSGLLVLPTGGGKTQTAVQWVLRNIINENKKVLWIAHRHELLEQALSTAKKNAISTLINKRKSFNYRIISGKHDRCRNIKKEDDFVIASKDSLYRGKNHLVENWLKYHDDIFLVIDEAHHATAKTYREIINVIDEQSERFKILGLTATPYRTAIEEKGLLKKVFKDDIVYEVALRTLISRRILAKPIFKELKTHISMSLTEQDMKTIIGLDSIPADMAIHIASNKIRNNRIVQEYVDNKDEYGKLLVFAVNKIHAIELNKLFKERGITSEYVISSDNDIVDDNGLSKENKEIIERYRQNKFDVLINVNILTEGTDVPDIQTVFLTRPTSSEILMTQMIGRALRGKNAGGTEKAFIVSFVDSWQDRIPWVNPKKLYEGEGIWNEQINVNSRKEPRLIPLKKIEEFIKIADDSVDTTELEKMDFIKTVPVGFYSFSLSNPAENGEVIEKNCEVLVYENTEKAYQALMKSLPKCFEAGELKGDEEVFELLDVDVVNQFLSDSETRPNTTLEDVKDIISYFALNRIEPPFLEFKDRDKYDVSTVAQYIYDNELGGKRKKEYIDTIWEREVSFKVYFNYNKLYFRKCIDNEILKLEEPEIYYETKAVS
ncbi:DEAD/DEAH box helicase [Schinkia azotoformans]|uniref:DEAD/DEAH box helicase n=1 Tax=Schinkia azotoformans TaxID=1454 RepID=UPI002DBD4353|nr:DEAD/DEAH box helicase [Schinkia azotoformans]MEC1759846.1 DEAD/DEAH box helicase [Schinkia azotoformans]